MRVVTSEKQENTNDPLNSINVPARLLLPGASEEAN
jgi:hypothetical protein